MGLNPEMFRAYDIRGIAPEELNSETAKPIGVAFGNLIDADTVVVSRDHRISGISITEGLVSGLLEAGKNVVDIGQNSTPVFYFAICRYGYGAGCQVTASHNPKEYNGIKLQLKDALPVDWETGMQELKDKVVNNEFKAAKSLGKRLKFDKNIEEDYSRFLLEHCKLSRKLKIVIDTGNGVVSKLPEKILSLKGCDVKTIFSEPDDSFPNHIADPHKHETLKSLQAEVVQSGADLGLAFDGDGDRLGVVDSRGRVLSDDKLLMMLSRKALAEKSGDVVYDIRVSKAVIEDARKNNGRVLMSRAGHSYVLRKLMQNDGVFGGELSGHLYYPLENYPYDDGIFTAMKVAEIASEKDIGEYVDSMPSYYATPEIVIEDTEKTKFEKVEKLKELLQAKGFEVTTIDGARVELENAWGLVRASNTGPHIKCRFEGLTQKDLDDVLAKVKPVMNEAGIDSQI